MTLFSTNLAHCGSVNPSPKLSAYRTASPVESLSRMEPNDDKLKLAFQIQLTSWPQTLEDANTLLEMAKQKHQNSDLLAACACILMATALDQAAWAKIVYAISDAADPKELPERYAGILEKDGTFKNRIDALPEILSFERLQLNKETSQVKSLYQLIRLRNGLVHIRDAMKDGLVEVSKDELKQGKINLGVGLPSYPWRAVSLKYAYEFRDSVSIYIRDVIETEEIEPGAIINRRG